MYLDAYKAARALARVSRPLTLAIASIAVVSRVLLAADTSALPTIRLGGLDLTPGRDRGSYRQVYPDSRVACGLREKKFKADFSSEFGMKITRRTQVELSTTLGIGAGIDELKAKLEIRNNLMREIERGVTTKLMVSTSQELTIAPAKCFDQYAVVVYAQDQYRVAVIQKGRLWDTVLDPFEWQENVDYQVWVEAVYREDCDASCGVPGKTRPVVGMVGDKENPLFARVAHAGTSYILPLFWGRRYQIIDPIVLLPKNVQIELQARGTDGVWLSSTTPSAGDGRTEGAAIVGRPPVIAPPTGSTLGVGRWP